MVNPLKGLPHHQWLIEFGQEPVSLTEFAAMIDQELRKRNTYYNDLIAGHVLEQLQVIALPNGTFRKYLASKGKLGGQNKVAHLSDNREIAEGLINLEI
jgi:hypothetical protein